MAFLNLTYALKPMNIVYTLEYLKEHVALHVIPRHISQAVEPA
jgi:hypothetical protein